MTKFDIHRISIFGFYGMFATYKCDHRNCERKPHWSVTGSVEVQVRTGNGVEDKSNSLRNTACNKHLVKVMSKIETSLDVWLKKNDPRAKEAKSYTHGVVVKKKRVRKKK